MPPIFNVNLDLNKSVQYVLEISIPPDETLNNTKTGYQLSSDYVGAMWFTVAVVLVYGVGTIGLLGISAKRNRALELMDKEVNAYLKSKFSAGGWADTRRKQMRVKRPVYELVRTPHNDGQEEKLVWALNTAQETTVYKSTSFYRKPKPKLVRAKTWAGTLTKSSMESRGAGAASTRSFGPLPVISEC